MRTTYLQLAQEQGGHRFGPFPSGAVYLGTDRGQCQIVLDASSGLAPLHAILNIGVDGYMLAQTDRANPLLVIPRGSTQAQHVSGSAPLQPGDTFILGPVHGPRFTIEAAAGPQRPPPGGPMGQRPGQPGYADKFGQEIHRQVETRLLTQVPMYREFQRWWYRYKTGALTNPRNLIGLAVVVVGFLFAACVGCSGVIFTLLTQFQP